MLESAKGDARMGHPLRYRGALSGGGDARRRGQLGGSADASNMFLQPTEQLMTEMVFGISTVVTGVTRNGERNGNLINPIALNPLAPTQSPTLGIINRLTSHDFQTPASSHQPAILVRTCLP